MLQTPMKGFAINGVVTNWQAPVPATPPQKSSIQASPVAALVSGPNSIKMDQVDKPGSVVLGTQKDSACLVSENLAKASNANKNATYIVDRISLGNQLVDSAMTLYGDNIRFHFDQQLASVDFDR